MAADESKKDERRPTRDADAETRSAAMGEGEFDVDFTVIRDEPSTDSTDSPGVGRSDQSPPALAKAWE